MKSKYTPSPLFDNLEYLGKDLIINRMIAELGIKDVQEDYAKAVEFLKSYRHNQATFNSYRRELERLFQWCWFIERISLSEFNRTNVEKFIHFCESPPKHWIGLTHEERFFTDQGMRLPNPAWRPFVVNISKKTRAQGHTPLVKNYKQSQSALQAIFSILSSFYNFLIQEDYASLNPIAQLRQKSQYLQKQQSKRQVRRLTELQWIYVIETAEKMAQADPAQHERTLFIMNALYGMYLRISELASSPRWQPQMGHFFRDNLGLWWFKTVGKGNKERDITVSDAMLDALKRYRKSLGLTDLPYPAENYPLLPTMNGKSVISTTRHIRRIVQNCFDQSIERLKQDDFKEEAEMLMTATVHWLRHTGISEDVKFRPREHVRDDAGHSSSAITDRYIDVELRARHESGRKKKINPEEDVALTNQEN